MLLTSQGSPCQPGNFLRAFRTVPEASALGLILSDLHPEAKLKTDLAALIQVFNNYLFIFGTFTNENLNRRVGTVLYYIKCM